MTIAIQVENLGKQYLLNHQSKERYQTLRDTLAGGVKRWAGKLSGNVDSSHSSSVEEFWALSGVDFEVRQGDRVGIIGRNGAGKSTLLKLLSRITEPTTGKVSIRGRVASLLEVGTGFHPELTGRENIYLNGAILGMSKQEIKRKFDEIVAFAEIEKFLDTPVKRYSSGMYVRLAFAVAAHLEPEILIVDEVLAVGDAQFQKKCLGKMDEVGKEGRTVLFVSHNMGIISQLCPTAIWLDKGRVRAIGETASITAAYMQNGVGEVGAEASFTADAAKPAQLMSVKLINQKGDLTQSFDCDYPIIVRLEIDVRKRLPGLYGYLGIDKPDGTKILVSDSFDASDANPLDGLPVGMHSIDIAIPARTLGHGDYLVVFSMACPSADQFQVDTPGVVCGFSVDDYTTKRGNLRAGYLSTRLDWKKRT
jgi:lipopolysaccharide transport system ATP-binding protein